MLMVNAAAALAQDHMPGDPSPAHGPARADRSDDDGKEPRGNLAQPAMELRFSRSRHYQTLYWRIDPDGKGEVSAPSPTGYATGFEPGSSDRYMFAGGVHPFDIGPDGYAELRQLLSDIVDGQIDHNGLADASPDAAGINCMIAPMLERPSPQLTWTGDSSGVFVLPSQACRSMRGNDLADRMRASWRVLARHMLERGQAGVIRQSLPLPPQSPDRPHLLIPYKLEFQQHEVRAGRTLHWHIAADGKGWIDLSDAMTFPVPPAISPLEFLALGKGHYRFDIGPKGYGQVHALLDTYVTGPDRLARCHDGSTDQPLIRLNWEFAPRGMAGRLDQDRGCHDLAERADKALAIILTGVQHDAAPGKDQPRTLTPSD